LKEKLKDRYITLALFFIAFGIAIIYQLVDLQIVNGKKYYEDSRYVTQKEREVIAPRGNIYDRNGVPIATNRQGFTLHIVRTEMENSEFNDMVLQLVNVMEKNGDKFQSTLDKYLTFNPITFNNQSEEKIRKWQKDVLGVKESNIMKTPEEVFKYLRDKKFEIDEKYTDEEAFKIMRVRHEILLEKWRFDTGNSLCLAKDISWETVAEIEEKNHIFRGISTDVEPIRQYINAEGIAHVLGYVRPISAEEYKELREEGYKNDDIIGKTGIEKQAERYLRGKNGRKKVGVDTNGVLTNDGIVGEPAIPGNDVVLTIDMKLQKVAAESLKNRIEWIRGLGGEKNFGDADAGAVVVQDVNTGEILAMASYPSYEPSIFLASSDDKEAQEAIKALNDPENKETSEFNRAIQGVYAPGSTFKPLTAIAALEEGVITPEQEILDSGSLTVPGNKTFRCLEYPVHGHGYLNLKKALETSCNIYFYDIGMNTTIDKIDKWAKYFGLGELTGIDLPNERKGVRANRENKQKLYKNQVDQIWRPVNTAMASIGQDDNAFTPIQMVNYISTLANGGKRYTPHLIKRVLKYDGSIVNEATPQYDEIPVKQSTIEAVKKGMIGVTTSIDGTAKEAFKDFPFEVAGKTGTAETGRESTQSSNAWFVAYAPADNPQVAVAVVVEKGVWGSYAAYIARDVLTEYFKLDGSEKIDDSIEPFEPVFTQ